MITDNLLKTGAEKCGDVWKIMNFSLSSDHIQNYLAQNGLALNVKTELEEENMEVNLS